MAITMKARKAPMRRYMRTTDGMYDLDAMREDAAAYAAKIATATFDPAYPLFATDARGVVFNLTDWDTAIAEAEASNAAGGRGFSPGSGATEWDARGSRNGE
jgi:hypothetical protein